MHRICQETKSVNKKNLKKAKATAFILLACIFFLSSLQTPKVTAVVSIFITPASGNVGTSLTVIAEIDTENGSYIVRWNGSLNVTTGYAEGTNVRTSFTVPQTALPAQGPDILVEIIDNTTKAIRSTTFELIREYHIEAITPQPPLQLQEGANTTFWVYITGGESNTSYASSITVKDPVNNTYPILTTINTNITGSGEKYITYPTNFTVGAHTNYTGRYSIAFNETLAASEFSVGLTNATQYALFQTVNIRAANYTYLAERAWVNITHNGETIFSEDVPANNSLIATNWKIPVNASIGTYTVTITNSTPLGTRKPVNDTQQFIVRKPVFAVQVQAVNLNDEPLSKIILEAYNTTAKVETVSTKPTGGATFLLEMGNYTFKALLKEVEIGVLLNQSIMENKALTIRCQLTNIKMLVTDRAGTPVPFVGLAVNYSYTTTANASKQEILTFATNYTGVWKLRNMFTNISYDIEARRYGLVFNQTSIENMATLPWFNITITLPTYTALIHVTDSKTSSAEGVKVEAYEWNGGSTQYKTTNSNGDASFSLTFGKYRIRAYKDDILLNETTIDLIQNQSSFIFRLATLNVDLNVVVLDYFGQPIPNAVVNVEQKVTVESVEDTTGPDGRVTFSGILGGDLRISIRIAGEESGTKDFYLADSKELSFHLERYVSVAGYVMETSQFVTAIALAMLIIAFIVGLTYKRLLKFPGKSK